MQEKSSAFYRTLVFIHAEPGPAARHLQRQGSSLRPRGTPNSHRHQDVPPHTCCGFCGDAGPRGPHVCAQETWFSSHLHRFYPCVELRLINTSVRKGKSRSCVGQSDRKWSQGLARAWLLMYSLRARTKGVNRQLLLLHNCEC